MLRQEEQAIQVEMADNHVVLSYPITLEGVEFTLKETKICSSFKPYEVTVNCYKITK